jgi:hypothetical protein
MFEGLFEYRKLFTDFFVSSEMHLVYKVLYVVCVFRSVFTQNDAEEHRPRSSAYNQMHEG